MKSFFTSFFGSCLGVIVSMLLLILIVVGMGLSSSNEKLISKNSILRLNLSGKVPEMSNKTPSSGSSELINPSEETIGLYRIIRLIEHAATDDKIKGISIENDFLSMGQASIQSLVRALEAFKKSGKFIYAYGDFYGQSAYYLASVADSIVLNPQGGVDMRGYGSTMPFFKDMFDKIGVEMEVFYAGDFKSATEPFRLNKMSDFNRLQMRELLTDMKNIMVNTVSKNRGISPADIETAMTQYSGRDADKALNAKIVDAIMYKDDYEEFVMKKAGQADDKKYKPVSLTDYNNSAKIKDTESGDKIALVYAEGDVTYGANTNGTINDKKYIKLLQKIEKDKDIKAVVLRINSPGGSAFTSDAIWHQIDQIKKSGKKVIASFGDYAASGGYYIGAGADKIVAEPSTLTGSIGVFMMFPNATKLLNDKIGVTFDTVKTHPFATTDLNPGLNMSEPERAFLRESTEHIYDLFLDRVSKGRKLSLDKTKEIARGRVWSGEKAKQLGLVDELGDINAAIALAAKTIGSTSYQIVEYPTVKEDFMATLIREIAKAGGNDEDASLLGPKDLKMYQIYKDYKGIMLCREPQMRLPFVLDGM